MKKYSFKFVCLLFFIAISHICYAGTRDPNTPDVKYIEYGSKFECVLKIAGFDNNNSPFSGSCVAIAPNWVITAAHVVDNNKTCHVQIGDRTEVVSRILKHPQYKKDIFGSFDLALCVIEGDFQLDFYPELYVDRDEVGKVCSMSGFGISGTFNGNTFVVDGKKRAGSNVIDGIDRKLLVCTPSRPGQKLTELEFLISPGDSGGGLFIGNKLAGIHSCVMASDKNTNSSYGDESGHTRISEYTKWIKNIIGDKK